LIALICPVAPISILMLMSIYGGPAGAQSVFAIVSLCMRLLCAHICFLYVLSEKAYDEYVEVTERKDIVVLKPEIYDYIKESVIKNRPNGKYGQFPFFMFEEKYNSSEIKGDYFGICIGSDSMCIKKA